MPNITVTVDAEVYRNARIAAARLGTSVSALVRRFLSEGMEMDRFDDELAPRLDPEEEDPRPRPRARSARPTLPPEELWDCDFVRPEEIQRRVDRLFSIAQQEGLIGGIEL